MNVNEILETHIQVSTDEEFCDHCVEEGFPKVIEVIEPGQYYYFVITMERTLNLCSNHVATLQQKQSENEKQT